MEEDVLVRVYGDYGGLGMEISAKTSSVREMHRNQA